VETSTSLPEDHRRPLTIPRAVRRVDSSSNRAERDRLFGLAARVYHVTLRGFAAGRVTWPEFVEAYRRLRTAWRAGQ
jgi:hypothetical protein